MTLFAVLSLFFALVAGAYALLSAVIALGQHQLARATRPSSGTPAGSLPISIVVPTREDGAGIRPLLQSLRGQVAKGDEVLLIDDHSSPAAYERLGLLLEEFRLPLKLLRNTGLPGKKNALACGIAEARHDIIFQTDADCSLDQDCLQVLRSAFREPGVAMVMGLVKMQAGSSGASRFAAVEYQSLQMAGLTLAALGKPLMGSAAALAYRREVHEQGRAVGREKSSGDDVFLIQAQQAKAPGSILALPECRVTTEAPFTWKDFLNQRIRWGAKAPAYPSVLARLVSVLVALYPLLTLSLLASSFIWPPGLAYGLLLAGLKYFLDTLNLLLWYRRFHSGIPWSAILQAGIIYPFYIVVVLALMPFLKPHWRGQKIDQQAPDQER